MQITEMRWQEMEREHLWKLIKSNNAMDEARSLEEIFKFLEKQADMAYFNSCSFALRRYIFEAFGHGTREEPKAYCVTLLVHGKYGQIQERTFHFEPVLAEQAPSEEDVQEYAEFLYRRTLEAHCWHVNKKGQVEKGKSAIPKADYAAYLRGDKRPTREKLFVISIVLDFKVEQMVEFMSAAGESPVYNLKDLDETICYYLHSRQDIMATMDRFWAIKEAWEQRGPAPERRQIAPGVTEAVRLGVDGLISRAKVIPSSEEERDRKFVDILWEQSAFNGYSLTARELFRREVEERDLLEFDEDLIEGDAAVYGYRYREDADMDVLEDVKPESLHALGTEVLTKTVGGEDVLRRRLRLDPRLREGLLDSARLRKLLSSGQKNVPVTKKDFLHLRFYKLCMNVDYKALSDAERRELFSEFCYTTDLVLKEAGLDPIYVAAPFDNLVLTALTQPDPLAYFSGVFCWAPEIPSR